MHVWVGDPPTQGARLTWDGCRQPRGPLWTLWGQVSDQSATSQRPVGDQSATSQRHALHIRRTEGPREGGQGGRGEGELMGSGHWTVATWGVAYRETGTANSNH